MTIRTNSCQHAKRIAYLIIFLQVQHIRLGVKFLSRAVIKPIMLQFLGIHFYTGCQGMFFMYAPGIIQPNGIGKISKNLFGRQRSSIDVTLLVIL